MAAVCGSVFFWIAQPWRTAARLALVAVCFGGNLAAAPGVLAAADEITPAEPAPAAEAPVPAGKTPAPAGNSPAPPPEPAPVPAAADDDAPAVILVEGHRRRLVAPADNPTRFVTQVEVARSTESLDSVSDELEKTVGVTVRRLGGLGSFSTISIRGSTPQQVEIFWDGIPLNRADSGLTNLEEIPMDLIERIEIYRGSAPAQFGAAGIGGVVNLITRRSPPRARDASGGSPAAPFGLISVTGGSWDTWKTDLLFGGPADSIDCLFFYNRLQSRGNFRYENDNGTPLNAADDHTETRVNNDFVQQDFFARLSGPLAVASDDPRWSLLIDGFDKEQGLAGLAAVQARHARLHTSRGIAAVQFEAAPVVETAAPPLVAGLNLLYEEVEFNDPAGELSFAPTDDLTVTYSLGANLRKGWTLIAQRAFLTLFGELRHEETQGIYKRPTISHGPPERREALTGVAQSEFRFARETIRIVPTLRGEVFLNRLEGDPRVLTPSQRGSNTATQQFLDPSLGLAWSPWPELEFKANAGRFYRVPTFSELFGNRGGVVGSPNLAPERADSFDIGFQFAPMTPAAWRVLGQLEFEYALFYTETHDLIALVRNSQNTSKAINIGAAQILGHEFSLQWDTAEPWSPGLWPSLWFNYTHQDPRDASDIAFLQGNYLPNQPVDAWFLRTECTYENRPAAALSKPPAAASAAAFLITAWFEIAYTGETFRDRANLYPVEARRVLNGGLKYRQPTAAGEFLLGFEVKNLTDNRVTDVAQFPLPGRSYFGTAQWKF